MVVRTSSFRVDVVPVFGDCVAQFIPPKGGDVEFQIVAADYAAIPQQSFRLLDVVANTLKPMRPVDKDDIEGCGRQFRQNHTRSTATRLYRFSDACRPDIMLEQMEDHVALRRCIHFAVMSLPFFLGVEVRLPRINADHLAGHSGSPQGQRPGDRGSSRPRPDFEDLQTPRRALPVPADEYTADDGVKILMAFGETLHRSQRTAKIRLSGE